MKIEAKTKLSEKPISWEEAYTPRTKRIKQQFSDIVGSGSYFRFEGKDRDSGDEYFVVVGPAKIHAPKAMFFAGVRKLPSDFAAGGKYFSELREAAKYATDTWGVTFPSDLKYYDASDLKGIGKKLDKWREEHKDDEVPDEEDDEMSKDASSSEMVCVASSSYPYYEIMTKEALAERLKKREGFYWYDLDDIMTGSDERFERMKETEPSLDKARNEAIRERSNRKTLISNIYGENYVDADFYKIWLVHKPGEGTYIVAVGPYVPKGTPIQNAVDKFSGFTRKLNVASQDEIDEKINSLMQEYADRFGVQLDASDISVDLENKPMVGEVTIGKTGREKIYNSPEWKRQVEDFYKTRGYEIPEGRGKVSKLMEAWREENRRWNTQLSEAYAQSQESGEAFKNQQPPPPKVGLTKRMYGQQFPTAIYRAPASQMTGMSEDQKAFQFGFDSIREAVEHLTAESLPGAPIGEVPDTTAEDLRRAREEVIARKGLDAMPAGYRSVGPRATPESTLSESPSVPATTPRAKRSPKTVKAPSETKTPAKEDIVAKPGKEVSPEKTTPQAEPVTEPAAEPVTEPAAEPAAESVVDKPQTEPRGFAHSELDLPDFGEINLEEYLGTENKKACIEETMMNLVKTAESLDKQGRHNEAEEIHKILRKHIGRI